MVTDYKKPGLPPGLSTIPKLPKTTPQSIPKRPRPVLDRPDLQGSRNVVDTRGAKTPLNVSSKGMRRINDLDTHSVTLIRKGTPYDTMYKKARRDIQADLDTKHHRAPTGVNIKEKSKNIAAHVTAFKTMLGARHTQHQPEIIPKPRMNPRKKNPNYRMK